MRQKSQQNRQYRRDDTIPHACLRILFANRSKVSGQGTYSHEDNNRRHTSCERFRFQWTAIFSTGFEDNKPALFHTNIADYEPRRILRLLYFKLDRAR